MKTILFIFLSLSCLASEPKFHFRDCVSIKNGFYSGCKGTVLKLETDGYYEVNVDDCKGYGFYDTFNEKDLEPAKGCK